MTTSQTLVMYIDLPLDLKERRSWPLGYKLTSFNPDRHPREARELMNLAYQYGGGDVLRFEEWWRTISIDSEFDQDLCFVVIDDATKAMAAFAHCWTTGFVKDIVVHPTRQRQGLGRALMGEVFHKLHERGLSQSKLKVLEDNPSAAATFYRSLGMKVAT